MLDKTTLPPMWWPLMDFTDITPPYCAVCGRPYPIERHHMVPRGAGSLFRDGELIRKPVIRLCGFGNNLKDADGRYYCHGKAHAGLLRFRANPETGELEYLDLVGKVNLVEAGKLKYQDALAMDGWKKLPRLEGTPWD